MYCSIKLCRGTCVNLKQIRNNNKEVKLPQIKQIILEIFFCLKKMLTINNRISKFIYAAGVCMHKNETSMETGKKNHNKFELFFIIKLNSRTDITENKYEW